MGSVGVLYRLLLAFGGGGWIGFKLDRMLATEAFNHPTAQHLALRVRRLTEI